MTRAIEGHGDGFERRHSDTSVPRPPNIGPSMNPGLDFPHPHYALIYIDENGKPQVEESASITGCGRAIFTPDVRDRFMEMASPNGHNVAQYVPSVGQVPSSSWNPQANPEWMYPNQQRPVELIPCEWQSHQTRRKRRDMKRTGLGMSPPQSSSPPPAQASERTILRIGNRDLLRRYYAKAFEEFQQLNCRSIAKSYIKLVEPRKQVHFPYNGRTTIAGVPQRVNPEMTKPGWWPSGVVHKEPDHLLKQDRVKLLVHILCELNDSHGITAEKLREASQEARRHITPPNRLEVLDEIYFVRKMEEKYLEGKMDGNKLIQVTKTLLPDTGISSEELPEGVLLASVKASDSTQENLGEDSPSNLDDSESPISTFQQEVPLTPTTSDTSTSHSPIPDFNTYPMGLMPGTMPHEPSSEMRQTAPDQFRAYYPQQFTPVEKDAIYWPNVPPSLQYGYR